MAGMTTNRPYLIRALYDWIVDNRMTPHLLVDANAPGVIVPQQFAQEGKIVLNISPDAVRGLEMANDMIGFNARFGGMPMDVLVPPATVLGIYAKENGRGMLFPDEGQDDEDDLPPDEPPTPTPGKRPMLKVVK
jgi:stringent starvation protein B